MQHLQSLPPYMKILETSNKGCRILSGKNAISINNQELLKYRKCLQKTHKNFGCQTTDQSQDYNITFLTYFFQHRVHHILQTDKTIGKSLLGMGNVASNFQQRGKFQERFITPHYIQTILQIFLVRAGASSVTQFYYRIRQ